MSNEDKCIDRTPFIQTAGLQKPRSKPVKDCLTIHTCDDAIETVLHEAGLHKVPFKQPLQRTVNTRHKGIFTDMRDLLNPPVETRYQTLIRDLKETAWQSYWLNELGTTRDPIGGLPPHLDPATTTFGRSTKSERTAKECINPPVPHYEILFDYAEHHDMYKKTHNDYYPGECISYNYDPPYDPKKRFGLKSKLSVPMKCCCKSLNVESFTVANEILSDHLERTKPRVGKPLTPNHNIKCMPDGHRFGIKSQREFLTCEDLIKPDIEACQMKKDFMLYMSALNETRTHFRTRKPNWRTLKAQCMYYDKTYCGWISLDKFNNVMSYNSINFPQEYILPLAEVFGSYKDNFVFYNKFIDLFDVNCRIPELGKFNEPGFDPSCVYMTMNQYNSLKGKHDKKMDQPAAGISTSIAETETTAKSLLNPSIMTNYELSYVDLLMPRNRQFLRTLFERLGYEFPNNSFEEMWQLGVEIDKNDNDMVCADTFKRIMYEATPFGVKNPSEFLCDYESIIRDHAM